MTTDFSNLVVWDARKLQIVHTTVKNYEQALRQKSDSIIKAGRKKAEEQR